MLNIMVMIKIMMECSDKYIKCGTVLCFVDMLVQNDWNSNKIWSIQKIYSN